MVCISNINTVRESNKLSTHNLNIPTTLIGRQEGDHGISASANPASRTVSKCYYTSEISARTNNARIWFHIVMYSVQLDFSCRLAENSNARRWNWIRPKEQRRHQTSTRGTSPSPSAFLTSKETSARAK